MVGLSGMGWVAIRSCALRRRHSRHGLGAPVWGVSIGVPVASTLASLVAFAALATFASLACLGWTLPVTTVPRIVRAIAPTMAH